VVAFKGYHRANPGLGKVEDEHKACVFPGLIPSHHFKYRGEVKKKLEELGLHFGMQVPEGWQDA
jgi:hypothetical protein